MIQEDKAVLTAGGRNGNNLVLFRAAKLSKAGDRSRLTTPPIRHFLEEAGVASVGAETDGWLMTSPHTQRNAMNDRVAAKSSVLENSAGDLGLPVFSCDH
ncbi:MAG: hypothetical protein P9F75_09555 [Candidatus Contendobacter sp.]|nr:hypothetical protein [Candidatus Contendobacter sp.]